MTLTTIYMLMTHLFIFLAPASPWIPSNISNCILDISILMSDRNHMFKIQISALEYPLTSNCLLPWLMATHPSSFSDKILVWFWFFLLFHNLYQSHRQVLKALPSKHIIIWPFPTTITALPWSMSLSSLTWIILITSKPVSSLGPTSLFKPEWSPYTVRQLCQPSAQILAKVSHLPLQSSPNLARTTEPYGVRSPASGTSGLMCAPRCLLCSSLVASLLFLQHSRHSPSHRRALLSFCWKTLHRNLQGSFPAGHIKCQCLMKPSPITLLKMVCSHSCAHFFVPFLWFLFPETLSMI